MSIDALHKIQSKIQQSELNPDTSNRGTREQPDELCQSTVHAGFLSCDSGRTPERAVRAMHLKKIKAIPKIILTDPGQTPACSDLEPQRLVHRSVSLPSCPHLPYLPHSGLGARTDRLLEGKLTTIWNITGSQLQPSQPAIHASINPSVCVCVSVSLCLCPCLCVCGFSWVNCKSSLQGEF